LPVHEAEHVGHIAERQLRIERFLTLGILIGLGLISTLSEHLSLFVKLLFAIGGIDSGLTFAVTDFHLAEDLLQRRIPPR